MLVQQILKFQSAGNDPINYNEEMGYIDVLKIVKEYL